MCPIPEKAIFLEKKEILLNNEEISVVQLPFVNRDLCIGCGICEYMCPIKGEAAIRIYVPSNQVAQT
jgi:ferredoxin